MAPAERLVLLGVSAALAMGGLGTIAFYKNAGGESVNWSGRSGSESAGQVSSGPSPSNEQPRGVLAPGAAVEVEMTGGEIHVYSVELARGDYLESETLQQGVDIVVGLYEPSGAEIVLVDSRNGRQGPEELRAVAVETGLHQIKLRCQDPGDLRGSYKLSIRTLRPASQEDRLRAEAAAIFSRGEKQRRQGDRASLLGAVESYERALVVWRRLGDPSQATNTLLILAETYRELKKFDAAQASFERTLPLVAELGDRGLEAEALNGLGLSYFEHRNNLRAEELFLKSVELSRTTKRLEVEAAALNNLAELRKDQGRFYQALELYEEALSGWRALGSRQREAVTLNNMGSLYSSLREIELAKSYYERSLELVRELGDRRLEAVRLNNLGVLFDRAEEPETALGYFNQVLDLWEELGEPSRMARVFNNIGRVHRQQDDIEGALSAYQRALSLARGAGNRDVEAAALHNLAWLYDDLGDEETAMRFYDELQGYFAKLTHERQATVLHGMARALRHQGAVDHAQAKLRKALEILDQVRDEIEDPTLRATFFATRREIYKYYVDLLMERAKTVPGSGYDPLAFEVSQEARGRSFLDAVSEGRAGNRRGADPALLAQERDLQRQVNAGDRRYRALIDRGESVAELAEVVRGQRVLLKRLERLRTRIRLSTPQSVTWMHPLGTREIQERILDRDTALLHYELASERSFVWVVTSESVHGRELAGQQQIEKAAREAAGLLAQSHHRSMEGASQQALSHLSELLLTPVADLLDRERLLVVGDGALEYVPFSALPQPSASWEGEPEPMISRFEIVRLPAVSMLAGLRQKRESSPPRRGALAVLADPVFEIDDPRVERQPTIYTEPLSGPEAGVDGGDVDTEGFRRLPGSRSEAEAILRRVAPEERFLALDFEASRDTVLNGTLRGYPIVHFATHAVVDPIQPELSGIVLSLVDKEGRRQDGFLRVHEIYGLDLPAELVVLSGCQTALGRELDGEGLIGLTRAFMFAGTRRLVVSLWRIDDQATAKLMDRFYGEMLGHRQAPSAALRLAQLSVAREPRWRAPFYWASFVLLGDWRALPNP